eukprot:SAG31_NODE_877_length_11303_cov_18.744556_10_plen_96_part_00
MVLRYGVANAPGLGRNISLLERSSRYIDVYTPIISSVYSQVQWSTHIVDFPPDFVAVRDVVCMVYMSGPHNARLQVLINSDPNRYCPLRNLTGKW